MKNILQLLWLVLPTLMLSQNIQVDATTYSPQQLVEDILINSSCIENIVVNNVVGGNFGGNDKSYGYFDANGSSFPFRSGIVLSTGKIVNTQGPNNTLSDDDASNWSGDSDLQTILNESSTTNATILEFDFDSPASQISFRYIFASEEYQEGDSNTCRYSDLFGFLIRPVGATEYTNIAIVPNTQTPVKVTTVHPDIPGGCQAVNEFYFDRFNDASAPINFNGQTKILTATADVVPNQTYHVKLVIADEQNYRYDSAVFLEAGSFKLSTELGPNLLTSTGNALCQDEIYTLDATQTNANNYKWFKDGVELTSETNATLLVDVPGVYNVEVKLTSNCISYGQIVIEYSPDVVVTDATLTECDQNQDGITLYNLYDAQSILTLNNSDLVVANYFLTEADANQNINVISNPNNFQNSIPNQIVFAKVESRAGCFKVARLQLAISTATLAINPQLVCDDAPTDGFTDFNLSTISESFRDQVPPDAVVTYYLTEADAFNTTNALSSPFRNTVIDSQTLFVKVTSNNQCYAIGTVNLKVLYAPTIQDDETVFYCENLFPEIVRIYGGVLNDAPSNYYYEWLFNGTPITDNSSYIDVNESGVYTVIVIDPNGCSATRDITVTASNIATIDNIIIEDGSSNNTVTIIASGNGLYQYALDDMDGFFQESNVFTNVLPGFHTVYVSDSNGCGIAEQLISVIGFPRYFTPNGDPYHETWQVFGVNEQFHPDIDIKIFNRYGKLLAQQNYLSGGWDGTLKGKPLPSDDYWYVATLKDGRMFKGHFTLVR